MCWSTTRESNATYMDGIFKEFKLLLSHQVE